MRRLDLVRYLHRIRSDQQCSVAGTSRSANRPGRVSRSSDHVLPRGKIVTFLRAILLSLTTE